MPGGVGRGREKLPLIRLAISLFDDFHKNGKWRVETLILPLLFKKKH
jgi:hypothetical protein